MPTSPAWACSTLSAINSFFFIGTGRSGEVGEEEESSKKVKMVVMRVRRTAAGAITIGAMSEPKEEQGKAVGKEIIEKKI